ncbi:hypothetical protein [Streptomyces violaceusniger]|uniref:hypothetical protein n=1 Tax=Streptomyces violaceusniger TaxID=68280 RepID=UPI00380BDF1B
MRTTHMDNEEIRARAEYDAAAIDARYLKEAYALWGDEGLKRALESMGRDRAAKARAVMDAEPQ